MGLFVENSDVKTSFSFFPICWTIHLFVIIHLEYDIEDETSENGFNKHQ